MHNNTKEISALIKSSVKHFVATIVSYELYISIHIVIQSSMRIDVIYLLNEVVLRMVYYVTDKQNLIMTQEFIFPKVHPW